MSKGIKRTVTLILALTMFVTLFAGCVVNKNTDPDKDTSEPTKTTAKKENYNPAGYPIVDEPIHVTCMHVLTAEVHNNTPNEVYYWKALRELTNITIDWELLEPDETLVNLYFASGDFPDFFMGQLNQERIDTYGIEGGVFQDISKLIYECMPHMVSRFKEYPDAEKVIKQTDGKVYTIPTVSLGTTAYSGAIHFRDDYMAEVGLPMPRTVDEFYDTLKTIQKSGLCKGKAPFLPYTKSHLQNNVENGLFPAFGEGLESQWDHDGKGKVLYNANTEQFKRYLQYMNKLYKEGLLEPEVYSIDGATCQARIKSGEAAFTTYMANLQPEDFLDGKMGINVLTPLTSEYSSTPKVNSYPFIGTSTGGINKNSKYAKEILRMLDCAYAKEEVSPGTGLDGWSVTLGVKGQSYEVDDSKNIFHLLAPSEAERVEKYGTTNVYMWLRREHAWSVPYGVYDFTYFNGDRNAYAREKCIAENLLPYSIDRFPDLNLKYSKADTTKMANKLTDINSYLEQMRAKFITGVEPFSNWDKYVAEIDKMGIKEVTEIKQRAFDLWNN